VVGDEGRRKWVKVVKGTNFQINNEEVLEL